MKDVETAQDGHNILHKSAKPVAHNEEQLRHIYEDSLESKTVDKVTVLLDADKEVLKTKSTNSQLEHHIPVPRLPNGSVTAPLFLNECVKVKEWRRTDWFWDESCTIAKKKRNRTLRIWQKDTSNEEKKIQYKIAQKEFMGSMKSAQTRVIINSKGRKIKALILSSMLPSLL